MKESEIPTDANVIGSHIVYEVKTEEEGTMRLKAIVCPHGSHDNEKDNIRKDSSTAPFVIISLMLALVKCTEDRLGLVHIEGSYLQSRPIQRKMYVRPPYD